ncbi:MAG: hypothetical protein GIKADHBN_00083 [Phycisphaerales bacterium]|nr:hypothetical protein [Phycisphaerales bacterium]
MQIDSVAVVSCSAAEPLRVDRPWQKSGAAGRGAAAGAGVTLAAGIEGATETYGISVLLGVVLAPVGAVVGAVVGYSQATEDAVVQADVERVMGTLEVMRPADEIAARIAAHARTDVRLPSRLMPSGTTVTPAQRPNEAVLELTVVAYGLQSVTGGINPDLSPFVLARGVLRSSTEQGEIGRREWLLTASPRKLSVWAAAPPDELRRELSGLQARIAQIASDELFRVVIIP